MTAGIADQLARLRGRWPGWVIWYGSHTSSWWALPAGPPDPDRWIEAASACALETALRSITAAASPPRRTAGRGMPLSAPVPAPRPAPARTGLVPVGRRG